MNKLINYLNPFGEKQELITQLSIGINIAVLVLALIYLLGAYLKYWLVFKKDAQSILLNNKVGKITREYEAGLFSLGGNKKSFISFQKKVPQDAIINHFFNDSILSSVSNILVGLGVLGTFLGLSQGVSGFVM